MQTVRVLASDMDGTFIPLDGNEQNLRDLPLLGEEVARHDLELLYVTGRHHALVMDAIESHGLPNPRWLICDVGTSIYRSDDSQPHRLVEAYQSHLAEVVENVDADSLSTVLSELPALRLQEPAKQGRFKLSYYCPASRLHDLEASVGERIAETESPYETIASVDPFTGSGLIDCLPRGVSKDYALGWWVNHLGRSREEIVFAGDSGNDLAALTAGYRSIIVSNADASVTERARELHRSVGWTDRLFVASRPATSGVLEGLRHYLSQELTSGDRDRRVHHRHRRHDLPGDGLH